MRTNRAVAWYLLLLLFCTPLFAQPHTPEKKSADNALSAELGGKGIFYTITYERLIIPELGLSVGFSTWDLEFIFNTHVTIFPLFVTYYTPGNGSRLYIDAGVDIVHLSDISLFDWGILGSATGVLGVVGTGYTYRSSSGGFFFKIGPMMFIGDGVQAWGNVTLGLTF
jgi:hypothetical protein